MIYQSSIKHVWQMQWWQVPVHHGVVVQESQAACDEWNHRQAGEILLHRRSSSRPAELNEADLYSYDTYQ